MLWTWLGVVIVLTVIEAMTVNLVTVWYIASAIVAMILSIFIDSFLIQFGVFVLLGTILLLTTRNYLVKLLGKKDEKTNLDRVVGMIAIVTKEMDKNKISIVCFDDPKNEISKVKVKQIKIIEYMITKETKETTKTKKTK